MTTEQSIIESLAYQLVDPCGSSLAVEKGQVTLVGCTSSIHSANDYTDEKREPNSLQPGWRRYSTRDTFTDDSVSCFKGFINLGNEHFRRGEYDEALISYKEAVEMIDTEHESEDTTVTLDSYLAIIAFHNMGVIYCVRRELQEGLRYFIKALILQKSSLHLDASNKSMYAEVKSLSVRKTVVKIIKVINEKEGIKAAEDFCYDAIQILRCKTYLEEISPLLQSILLMSIEFSRLRWRE